MDCKCGIPMAPFEGETITVEDGKSLNGISGWRCPACGDVTFGHDSARAIFHLDPDAERARRSAEFTERYIRIMVGLASRPDKTRALPDDLVAVINTAAAGNLAEADTLFRSYLDSISADTLSEVVPLRSGHRRDETIT